MRDVPTELAELLERLGLAGPRDMLRAQRLARSLAKGLPLFDSVWIDALVRRQVLTPFQAARIHAGADETLRVGPYVLLAPLDHFGYAESYLARSRETSELVRLLVAPAACTSEQLHMLRNAAEQLDHAHQAGAVRSILPLRLMGIDGDSFWAAQALDDGISARAWLVRRGRVQPELVLEIARQMAAALADLESYGLVHGDLSASSLRLTSTGEVHLAGFAVRSAVRPVEEDDRADLLLTAYDYLAPERVAAGVPADRKSDLYAAGCLWWQLLTGRPPLPGGDVRSKLKSVRAGQIAKVCRLAPETPPALATAIERLTQPDRCLRPDSFRELAAELGGSTPDGRAVLARSIAQAVPRAERSLCVAGAKRRTKRIKRHVAAACKPATADCDAPLAARSSSVSKQIAWPIRALLSVRWKAIPKPLALAAVVAAVGIFAAVLWPAGGSVDSAARVAHSGRGNNLPSLDDRSEAGAKPRVAGTTHSEQIALQTAIWAEQTGAGDARVNHDQHVSPASHLESDGGLRIPEIRLPADRVTSAASIELHPHLRLSAPPGKRARIQLPSGGWRIDVEQLRCENIDFLLPDAASSDTTTMFQLHAAQAAFHGCSFHAPPDVVEKSRAILWRAPESAVPRDRLPPAGHLLFVDCTFAGLHTGIDCRRAGPLVVEMENVLFAGPAEAHRAGSLWRIDRAPANDETFVLRMNACTLRDAMALIDVYYPLIPSHPGRLQVEATDCVCAPRSSGALLRMIGPARPDALLRNIVWRGHGSLLPAAGRFSLWYDDSGEPHILDDAPVAVDGLVRGGFEFASRHPQQPADSTLTHWAAPLHGDARPGIRAASLPDLRR